MRCTFQHAESRHQATVRMLASPAESPCKPICASFRTDGSFSPFRNVYRCYGALRRSNRDNQPVHRGVGFLAPLLHLPFQVERIFANQPAVVRVCVKFLTQRAFNCGSVFQCLNRTVRCGSHGDIECVEQVSMTVHRIFTVTFGAGEFRSLQSIAAPTRSTSKPARTAHEAGSAGCTEQEAHALCRRCEDQKRDHPCDRDGGVNFRRSIEARRSCVTILSRLCDLHRPLYFHVESLAGSGHEFQGRLFFSRLHYTQRQILSNLPAKPDPFTITPVVRPLKTPSVAFWRKNAKRQENTRPNQKNASESFSGRCITMHESDVRSVSCVLNTERLKTTRFLSLNGAFYTEIFVPLSIILITGFPS